MAKLKIKSLIGDFKPKQKGLGKVLGPLEAAVMDIIWRKEEATVRDVYETLNGSRKIAYTTVMTIMTRLADKDLLLKDKEGIAYTYRPAVSKEFFTKSLVGEVMDGLFDDYADAAFSHFMERVEEDEDKIAQLEQLIKNRRDKGE